MTMSSLGSNVLTTIAPTALQEMRSRLGDVGVGSTAATIALATAWWAARSSAVDGSPAPAVSLRVVDGGRTTTEISTTPLFGSSSPGEVGLVDVAGGLDTVAALRNRTEKSEDTAVIAEVGSVRVSTRLDGDGLGVSTDAPVSPDDLTDLVGDLVTHPDRRLDSVRPDTAEQRLRRQRRWNDTDAPRRRPDVVELIADHVRATPDALAVIDDRHRLSYRELWLRAASLADELEDRGIGDEALVGIAMDRGADMVVAIVAALMTGGAFVPVDPEWPDARRRDVIGRAQVRVLVTRRGADSPHDGADDPAIIEFDCDAELPDQEVDPVTRPMRGAGLAYVVFTSGSTGKPKGAMIRREAIVERLLWQRDEILGFGPTNAALFKAPLAFDISINEILLPLISGGRVVVAHAGGERDPQYLLDLIAREHVTFAYLVSSMLDVLLALADGGSRLDSLRHVWCGGELLTQALFRRFREQLQIPMYHGYGPAEATIGVSHVIYAGDDDRMGPSIGSANPNTALYVLDAELRPSVAGEPGELYAAGFLLGRGYVGQGDLTAARYVADPFGRPGERMYRTGDLARRLDDGSLEFLGRADNQVKVRGMRLELEDVEAGLAEHPDVRMPCVTLQDGRLIGYVVCHRGRHPSGADIREWSRSVLPDYMVPATVMVLDAFPMTVNGKLDRRALPDPDFSEALGPQPDLAVGEPRAEASPALAAVTAALAGALGIDRIGPDTDFFDVGGDSLRAIGVLGALRREGWSATVSDVFDARTPRALAARVTRAGHQPDPDDRPDGVVDAMPIIRWAGEIAEHIDGFVQAVELRAPDDLDQAAAQSILTATVRAHPALAATVVTGPRLHLRIPRAEEIDVVPVTELASGTADESIELLTGQLDPAHGVVLAAGLRVAADGTRGLLVVIHHLVIDGVSWDILTDDLTRAMAAWREGLLDDSGSPTTDVDPPVQAEGTSLRRWSELLIAAAPDIEADRTYFDDVLAHPDTPLADDPTELTARVADEVTRVHEFGGPGAEALLGEVVTGYAATAEAVLMTALSLTLARFRSEHRPSDHQGAHAHTHSVIELEGHGRETRHIPTPGGGEADLSRTVGWFTTLYPVLVDPGVVDLDDPAEVSRALKAVKDQLAVVPHRGIGYGIGRYLGPEADTAPDRSPQVLFNYLGRVGTPEAKDFAPLGPTGQLGERRDPRQRLPRELEFNAITEPGPDGPVLRTTISWAAGRFGDDRIGRLLDLWERSLRAVSGIAALASHSAGDFALTPGGEVILDQDELDAIDGPRLVDVLPLTPLQQGMHFHSIFDGAQSSMYVEQQILTLRGTLDVERLRTAAAMLLRRRPTLAAAFRTTRSGRVYQVLDTDCADRLEFTVLDAASGPASIDEIARADRDRGFDPESAPLMRYTVIPDGDDHVVVQTVHHLIADGWSVPIALRELFAAYRDAGYRDADYLDTAERDRTEVPAHRLDRGFAGYLRWIAARPHDADVARWRDELAGRLHPVVVAPGATASSALSEMSLDAPELATLAARTRAAGLRLPDVVEAAWGLALRRMTGVDDGTDVVFGSTVSGRDAPVDGIDDAVGMFINTVPVRAPGAAPTRRARDLVDGLAAHHDRVRDCLHIGLTDIARTAGRSAGELFDTLVVVEIGTGGDQIDTSGTGLEIVDIVNDGAPHYPLTLVITPDAPAPLRLIHDESVIPRARAERIAAHLVTATTMLLTDCTVAEVSSALDSLDDDDDATLAQVWTAAVRAHRSRPALGDLRAQSAQSTRTYGEIDSTATALAEQIRRTLPAPTPGDPPPRVALLIDRSSRFAEAVIAAVLAGVTYVPLDPYSPQQRLDLIVDDCRPALIVASPDHAGLAKRLADDHIPVLCPDPDRCDTPAEPDCALPQPHRVRPDDPAYLLYTSGSTGVPKGVVVTHRNVVSLLRNAESHVVTGPDDIWCVAHSFAFDFSVWELWAPLRAGALAVVVDHALTRIPADLACALRDARITVLNQTPTAFAALDATGVTLPDLRYLVFGGERLEPALTGRWLDRHPGAVAINMYGITETTVHVTALTLTDGIREDTGSPIGRPLDGLVTHVLDEQLRPVAVGETGILYVSGPQVSAGYHRRPDLTATRFVANPFRTNHLRSGGDRLYCSGDVVRVRADGGMDYIGRADRQVQVRGFRIETGEVEAALRRSGVATEAAVLAIDTDDGPRLRAAIVADGAPGSGEDHAARARRAAREALPAHMVPDEVLVVDALPRTVNGKRDDERLRELLVAIPVAEIPEMAAPDSGDPHVPDSRVTAVASVIAEALDLDAVGGNDDFFMLGGDSIVAIRVANRLTASGVKVTPRDVFLGRTPARIAERLGAGAVAVMSTAAPDSGTGAAPVPTPILLRQHEWGFPDDLVQARLLRTPQGVTADQLRTALTAVVEAHPMLGAVITGTEADAALSISMPESGPATPPVRESASADPADSVRELIGDISIADGRPIAAALLDAGQCVVLLAHHAVVDSVSWMVIVDDLEQALRGRRPAAEPSSYATYAQQVMRAAYSPVIASDLEHWRNLHTTDPLFAATVFDAHRITTHTVEVDGPEVAVVVDEAAPALGGTVTDVIVALMLASVARLLGTEPTLLVDVEGHGRPDPGEPVRGGDAALDCGRTVGWFTQIAPVRVTARADAAVTSRELTAALADQPDPLGYMALRHIHARTSRLLAEGGAQILVNYLGRGESREVLPTPPPALPPRTPYAVEADVWVSGSSPRLVVQFAVAESISDIVGQGITAETITDAVRSSVGALAVEIDRTADRGPVPVPPTVLQRGLLFQSQVAPSGSYHAQTALTFDREIDPDQLAEAFADAVVVHPAMGARFDLAAATPTQYLPGRGERVLLPVEIVHTDDTSADEHALRERDRAQAIPLDRSPAARATIVRRAGHGDTVLFTYHLALLDGWSRARFLTEFLDRLRDREQSAVRTPRPARPGFAEVASLLEARDHRQDLAFWRSVLGGMVGPTLLGRPAELDAPPPAAAEELPRKIIRSLDTTETADLLAAGRAHGVTLTALATVAMALTLHRATGESDVIFGLSVSGRDLLEVPGIDEVVGVLLNTVPVRVEVDAWRPVREMLRSVSDARAAAMPHDGADLGEIHRELGVTALFDSLVVIQNFLDPEAARETRDRHGILTEEAEDSTHFALTWVFTPGDEMTLKVEYRAELVDETTATRLADHAMAVLRALSRTAQAPGTPLAALPVASDPAGSGPNPAAVAAANEPWSSTVMDEFAAAVRREPESVALVCGAVRWSLGELADRVMRLAGRLAEASIAPGSTVAIAVPRSAEVVVAILGVLWSGARYTPLDLEHPDDRLRAICDDCDPDIVLVSDESSHRMSTVLPADRLMPVTDDPAAPALAASRARADGDAYVIYTSGSTGTPKGVVIGHAGLANMLANHRRRIFAPAVRAANRRFRVAHAISFAFDMSWEELLWLAEGHEVHICDEELRRDATGLVTYVAEQRIDVLNVTPGQADQLVAEGLLGAQAHIPPLILLGGEAVSTTLWARLRATAGTRGYNLYGPTEYTINTLGVGTDESATPSIGRPVDNTEVMILDKWLRPVPDGVAGELYVTGVGLARGYLHLAARTAATMVACPAGAAGERMYRTGDLVRRNTDGLIDYLGRTDDQVKIRGHRVDPGEVSAVVLERFPDRVRDAVTLARDGVLCCHLVADTDDPAHLTTLVRDGLRDALPDYLVPTRFSVQERIPLTLNGKIDHAKLGTGDLVESGGRPLAGPQEELVAELMAEALDCDDFDSDVDFFAVGGHSMSAVRLAALLRGEFGRPVSVREVYELRTVSAMAAEFG
ncbi:non-ribosomal peptide synthetase [Gordonia polyisoprenivorans VH2]|uniref:Non-ribosomal peptide synthetase n=2 Tax=Gordonia polyisoprenivorans TaxID=84595 RepID=H6MVZ9_GORPV|nr:non-ribosomal peptide synthetase [Gordonia polyisoprenivorans VH2]